MHVLMAHLSPGPFLSPLVIIWLNFRGSTELPSSTDFDPDPACFSTCSGGGSWQSFCRLQRILQVATAKAKISAAGLQVREDKISGAWKSLALTLALKMPVSAACCPSPISATLAEISVE